jgi:tetratricopeptide (TPR) repeat protein
MVGPDAVLLGSFAPAVTLGTDITAVSYLDPSREEDVITRYGVTHILLDDRHDPRNLQEMYPDLDSRVTFLQGWSFRARNVLSLRLYRVLDAPGYAPTAFERGVALAQESKWDEAIAAYAEHRATGAPVNRELLIHESAARYRLGDPEAASRLLGRALELRPSDPQVLDSLALLAQERGDVVAAEEYFRRALRADPHNAEIIRKLRRLLEVE